MIREKAIKLLMEYFGFTKKEATEYYKKASECGEIDEIIKEIENYYKVQASYDD